MGADIYLQSIHNARCAEYESLADAVFEKMRDMPDGAEREKLHAEWREYKDKMYSSDCYFRDSYNPSSLLWVVKLSWWNDIGEKLDDNGTLTPEHCQWLLDFLKKESTLSLIQNLEVNLEDWDNETIESLREYFMDKHARFCGLLSKAIELKEGLYCSI